MAKNSSKAIISGTFQFDPEDYLDKGLLFDLRKTSEEKIFDAIIEKIPDNDKYYIKHRQGTNTFCIKKMKNKEKKTSWFNLLKILIGK